MCGRYQISLEAGDAQLCGIIDALNRKYRGTEALAAMKTGEVFPTDVVPVIAASGPELMAWGFPMQGKSQPLINARAETIFARPMFRDAVASRRVVVPTSGFYEWTHEGRKATDKFLFRLPNEAVLYLAGIYTEFDLPEGRQARFAIVTTAANESMRPYHDRMPVYIGRDEIDAWIIDGKLAGEVLRRVQPALMAEPVPKRAARIEQTRLF